MKDTTIVATVLALAFLAAPPAGAQCNSAPVAVDDAVEHFAQPIVVDALANDSDADGEALSVVLLGTSCSGTLTVDLGLVRLAPPHGFAENCSITYRAQDEAGNLSALTTVTVISRAEIFSDDFESGDLDLWFSCSEGSCPVEG